MLEFRKRAYHSLVIHRKDYHSLEMGRKGLGSHKMVFGMGLGMCRMGYRSSEKGINNRCLALGRRNRL